MHSDASSFRHFKPVQKSYAINLFHCIIFLTSLNLFDSFETCSLSIIELIEFVKKQYLNSWFRSETRFQSCSHQKLGNCNQMFKSSHVWLCMTWKLFDCVTSLSSSFDIIFNKLKLVWQFWNLLSVYYWTHRICKKKYLNSWFRSETRFQSCSHQKFHT